MILGLLVACGNSIVVDEKEDTKVGNEETEDADCSSTIESDYCYLIQETNELGDLVDSYTCMVFDKNVGSSFDEA